MSYMGGSNTNCHTCDGTLQLEKERKRTLSDTESITVQILACQECGMLHRKTIQITEGKIVAEATTQDVSGDEANAMSRTDLLEKLRRLEENYRAIESSKKAAVSDYNDQLKSIKDEIADVLAALENTPAEG